MLYGIGIVFIFTGIAWAALTRRTRSVHSLVSEEKVGQRARKRGVEAIFSPEENPEERAVARPRWISKRLFADVIELSLLLILYAGFVDEYSASLYFRSWIRANIPWAAYLLNYYALLTVATVVGVLLIVLIQKQRLEPLRT